MGERMMASRARRDAEWREFERMVARIETDAGPRGMLVRSPDRIRSKVTGRLREVNASIRFKIGSAEVLITHECRRQKRVQDVTWIEQLSSNNTAIGADRTIAVSASGFPSEAKKVADKSGISIRKMEDVSIADINSFLRLDFGKFWHRVCYVARVGIRKFRSLAWKMPGSEDVDFNLSENSCGRNAHCCAPPAQIRTWSLNHTAPTSGD